MSKIFNAMVQLKTLKNGSLFSINGQVFKKGSYDRSLRGYVVMSRRCNTPDYDVECGFVPSASLVKPINS